MNHKTCQLGYECQFENRGVKNITYDNGEITPIGVILCCKKNIRNMDLWLYEYG
jgi:hypothetical protein